MPHALVRTGRVGPGDGKHVRRRLTSSLASVSWFAASAVHMWRRVRELLLGPKFPRKNMWFNLLCPRACVCLCVCSCTCPVEGADYVRTERQIASWVIGKQTRTTFWLQSICSKPELLYFFFVRKTSIYVHTNRPALRHGSDEKPHACFF